MKIEPDLTLWGIYTSPTAIYNSGKEKAQDEEVPDLLQSLKAAIPGSRSPMVVHGQPGHGKTSSMRMLTQVLAMDPNDPVDTLLFYEFKNLGDLNTELIRTLQRVTPFVEKESFFHGKQTVLILDGMDERQIGDGTDRNLGNFIRDIFELAEKINKKADSRLNVIFTGRTLFIEQTKRYFTEDYQHFEILDFNEQQIDSWFVKFNNLKKLENPINRDTLLSHHLDQLIGQPILLTIAARILADPLGIDMLEGVPKNEITRGRIYKIIVSWTFQRKHQDKKGVSTLPNEIDEATYTRFLQMVAFLMFRRGEENIPLRDLAKEPGGQERVFST